MLDLFKEWGVVSDQQGLAVDFKSNSFLASSLQQEYGGGSSGAELDGDSSTREEGGGGQDDMTYSEANEGLQATEKPAVNVRP